MHLLLFALLVHPFPAHADEPSEEPGGGVSSAAGQDPALALQLATEAYALGDFMRARAAFLELVQRATVLGDVPFPVEATAWIYLGEMQFLEGNRTSAEASFRMVLQRDSGFTLSPVVHDYEVIGFFEVVRTTVLAEKSAARERRKPYPWWGFAPFGVPQFKQDRPVRGTVYAVLQVGFAAASVGAWFAVDAAAAQVPAKVSRADAAEAEALRLRTQQLRDGLSFTTAAAFYVSWAISVADGGISWRRDQSASLGLGVAPAPGGASLVVGGRF